MKFLSFDVESNGLHGDAFAVAALLIAADGSTEAEFLGRCPITGPVDPWVRDNVLPPMTGIPENFATFAALRTGFWEWYAQHKPAANYVLANNPYPVEARFLLACQADDPETRYTEHPFPLIDLASLLVAGGITTKPSKDAFMAAVIGDTPDEAHNPKWDAWITARAALRALDAAGHHA
jgi:hypothetical protein